MEKKRGGNLDTETDMYIRTTPYEVVLYKVRNYQKLGERHSEGVRLH